MTLIDPADSPNWPAARHNMLRLLAASGTGAGADFAKDILAGARQPHELLSHRPVTDELVEQGAAFRRLLDKIPPAELRELHAHAQEAVRREVDELASLDIEAAEAELRAASEPQRLAEIMAETVGGDPAGAHILAEAERDFPAPEQSDEESDAAKNQLRLGEIEDDGYGRPGPLPQTRTSLEDDRDDGDFSDETIRGR